MNNNTTEERCIGASGSSRSKYIYTYAGIFRDCVVKAERHLRVNDEGFDSLILHPRRVLSIHFWSTTGQRWFITVAYRICTTRATKRHSADRHTVQTRSTPPMEMIKIHLTKDHIDGQTTSPQRKLVTPREIPPRSLSHGERAEASRDAATWRGPRDCSKYEKAWGETEGRRKRNAVRADPAAGQASRIGQKLPARRGGGRALQRKPRRPGAGGGGREREGVGESV